MTAKQTGIDFRNDVKEDSIFNGVTYRNFFNGGGVAIGDINNDGLADVMLTANQGANRLFLNKGNFQFQDITERSGIRKRQGWTTGITLADVNADGLLDIYLCAAGIVPGDPRKNELYINRGNATFSEEADAYHVADPGAIHTHASFFDYDGDGDLDLYLLNNSGLTSVSKFGRGSNRAIRNRVMGNKLLRNDGGVYNDVTDSSGIFGSSIGFGLGLATGDVNGDKWPDLYISNDFFEKDYLYINQRNGRFREMSDTAISQMSQSSMGSDLADLNNDGLADIFTTDMLPEGEYRLKKNTRFDDYDLYNEKVRSGFHHQYLSNMLHLNNGTGSFTEIAQFAGVNATDWSWGALIFDCNNDGWKDINVSNGIYLDITDQDYIDYTANENSKTMFNAQPNVTSYDRVKAMLVSVPVPNYQFINQKNLQFRNDSYALGLGEPSYSNGAAYGDLDNDGDLDLVVNNLNSECFVYRNNSTEKSGKHFLQLSFDGPKNNPFGIGAEATIYANGLQQTAQNFTARGFQSSVPPLLHFGLDTLSSVDSIVVVWPDMKKQVIRNPEINRVLKISYSDANGMFQLPAIKGKSLFNEVTSSTFVGDISHKENTFIDFNRERLLPRMLSREGPKLSVADVNGDGLDDVFVGGAKHDASKLYVQQRNGKFVLTTQKAFDADKQFESIGSVFADIDQDGDADLVIASGGNLEQAGSELLAPRIYLNDGEGIFTRDHNAFSNISVNASCIVVADINNDKYPDIFLGGRSVPGEYGTSPKSYILQNNYGKFVDVTTTVAPALQHAGMITDATWIDINKDGIQELVTVGEWMPLTVFEKINGVYQPQQAALPANINGWWNCIEAADIDGDGDVDLIAGNVGLNTKIKVDSAHPAHLHVNDFDKNGTTECVMSYYGADGGTYPYYMRSELVTQIPSLKKRFLKYKDYAAKQTKEVFNEQELSSSVVKQADEFRTCIFRNDGNGVFAKVPLPDVVQFSSVHAISIYDWNHDGINDIFLGGNFYHFVPQFGRLDGSMGSLLLGKGGMEFTPLTSTESGISCHGEIRDAAIVKTIKGKPALVVARNNAPLLMYSEEH